LLTKDIAMHKYLTITLAAAGLATFVAAPDSAQARFGPAAIADAVAAAPYAQQVQNYGNYGYRTLQQPYAQPQPYTPPTFNLPPPTYVAPRYNSNAYWDYRHYGDPTTRDSLNTCSYC
jgi:hypothetical protein